MITKKSIPGFPDYSIDADGVAWGKSGKPMKGSPSWNGYLKVCLRRDGKKYHLFLHSLALITYVGPRPPGMVACHNDGNKTNNRPSNLRWDTREANDAERAIHGSNPMGRSNGNSKITEEQARMIARAKQSGGRKWGCARIARDLGISVGEVSRIATGRAWASVTGLPYWPVSGNVKRRDMQSPTERAGSPQGGADNGK